MFILTITTTELKNNLDEYLALSLTEDIYITQHGEIVSKLTNPFQRRVDTAKSLFGILSDEVSVEKAKEERISMK